jgi:hypothetical protein
MASMVTASAGRRAATKRTALDETSKGICPAAGALRRIGIKIVLPDRIVLDRDCGGEFDLRKSRKWHRKPSFTNPLSMVCTKARPD